MKIKEIQSYLQKDVWLERTSTLPIWKARGIIVLRVLLLTARKFEKDKVAMGASAMTFFSLLSIVPVIAMVFGIAQGFISKEQIEAKLREAFVGQEAVMEKVVEFANSMLSRSSGGVMAGIGFLTLAYSVLKLMENIERAFNSIWEVKKPRTYLRKLTDYITFIIVAPILVFIVQGLNILGTQMERIAANFQITEGVVSIIDFFLGFLPFTFLWLLLTLMYVVMPNYKVSVRAAFVGGIFAGSSYQLVQWAYVNFQIGANSSSAVYGSFAALPLFLAQMQIGWLLILIGCTLSYSIQNVRKFERYVPGVSPRQKDIRLHALVVMYEILNRFKEKKEAHSIHSLAEATDLPYKKLEYLLELLVNAKLINERYLETQDKPVYQPELDTDFINVMYVLEGIDGLGQAIEDLKKSPAYSQMEFLLEGMQAQNAASGNNALLKELLKER